MLQLDRYWSLDIWLHCLKRSMADSSNTISWLKIFSSCCHPINIFQVLCLHHIIDCRLHKTGVFVMVVKQPKYKVFFASVVALTCWFCNPLLYNGFHLIVNLLNIRLTSLIFIVIAFVDVECSAIVFYSNDSVDLKVSIGWQGMIWKMDEMVIGICFKDNRSIITFVLFYDVPGRGDWPPPRWQWRAPAWK